MLICMARKEYSSAFLSELGFKPKCSFKFLRKFGFCKNVNVRQNFHENGSNNSKSFDSICFQIFSSCRAHLLFCLKHTVAKILVYFSKQFPRNAKFFVSTLVRDSEPAKSSENKNVMLSGEKVIRVENLSASS